MSSGTFFGGGAPSQRLSEITVADSPDDDSGVALGEILGSLELENLSLMAVVVVVVRLLVVVVAAVVAAATDAVGWTVAVRLASDWDPTEHTGVAVGAIPGACTVAEDDDVDGTDSSAVVEHWEKQHD